MARPSAAQTARSAKRTNRTISSTTHHTACDLQDVPEASGSYQKPQATHTESRASVQWLIDVYGTHVLLVRM